MEQRKRESKKIRKGDKVMAIAGNERGQVGQVLRIIVDKAVVQGLNVRKKHLKPSQANPRGGIVDFERPIHISNLRVCTEDNNPIKLKIRFDSKGERELYYKIDGQEVLYRPVKTQKA
ncbi:MAG: 50S ribosomal protein L24 [Parachlamydia sp.]|nr:50S ribosomal protein L24 [Parachlamydia sp.]